MVLNTSSRGTGIGKLYWHTLAAVIAVKGKNWQQVLLVVLWFEN
jgi:hypothetical protein